MPARREDEGLEGLGVRAATIFAGRVTPRYGYRVLARNTYTWNDTKRFGRCYTGSAAATAGETER